MISTAAPGMGVVMLVMSHPGATEICISKPLSESIMTFSDIDTHRKCSNLAIKQPLQGRNHTVICNSDVFIYSYSTQFIEGDKTHVLFVIIGCHTYLDLLYSTHCVLYSRDGHIVYHYYGIRCNLQNEKVTLKEALIWRHDIWNLLVYFGLKQVFLGMVLQTFYASFNI